MVTKTETELNTPKQRAPAPPASDSQKKHVGFFKRHLSSRRRSSVTFPNAQPNSPITQARSPSPTQTRVQPARSAMRKASVGSENELKQINTNGTDRTDGTTGTAVSGDIDVSTPRTPSRPGGVRWAAGFDDLPAPRPRRTSSNGTGRRSSIYLRVEGLHVEGVETGAGSKARKLSLAIPDELHVDECALNDHFSVFARAGKKPIGEGGAATVQTMQSKTAGKDSKIVAVKEFRDWEPEEEAQWEYERKIKSEYAIAKASSHPNIVETYRLCYSGKKWFHVMEYCELGDLNDLITQGYFSRDDRNCMFKQLLRGVAYLHNCGIAHRDLKSENLLVTREGCLKIADFGTAEVFSGKHPGIDGCKTLSPIDDKEEVRLCKPGMVGSRPYMAPEILKHDYDYDPRAVDVWSCAIVYITLCFGGTPWDCASADVKNFNIYCNSWEDWLDKYPDGEVIKGRPLPGFVATKNFAQLDDPGTRTMIMGMLHPDPHHRWSAHDALDTKTVTEYPCCQQAGYSDDIKTRQRKVLHNHVPPKDRKSGSRFKSK